MGRPCLVRSHNYLKLADQGLIEHIGVLKSTNTIIVGIWKTVDYDVIDLVEGMTPYPTLVDQPWGWKMKVTISLEKDIINLKRQGKRIIIPLNSKDGKPWSEPCDEEVDIKK